MPDAERIDTDLVMVTGKLPLDAESRRDTPAPFFDGPTLILGPRGGCMFGGAVEYPHDHQSIYDREEYVMWGFSAHRVILRIEGAADELSGESARAAVLAQMSDWNRSLHGLVERAQASSLSSFFVKTSVPIDPWNTTRVTLLGDALHNMTPFRGIGANTALRDAALLRDTLSEVTADRRELLPALAAYEREMIDYGFAAVRASLAQAKRLHAQSPLKRFTTKAVFRLLDMSLPLKRRMLDLSVGG